MSKIRTAVVGLNMGYGHAQAYYLAERSELAYVVDLDESKAARVAKEFGCKYATDWTTILDEVDAVSLCTPHHLHASQSLIAIEAGKHVLLEKPLANSEEDCHRVIERAEQQGVTLMMAYIVRYLPALRRLKEALDSGRYGAPISAQCWVQGYLEPMPGSWFSKRDMLGGGVLFSHGCHYIDIFIWLLGQPKQVVQFGTRVGTEWMEGEGTSHSLIEFENGAIGNLVCSWGMKAAAPPAKYQIHTTEGMLVLDNRMWKVDWVTRNGAETLYERSADEASKRIRNESYEIEHFLDCIETGKSPETDGYDTMKSHRAIWAMYRSKGETIL